MRNLYQEWNIKNAFNQNRIHNKVWIDDDTLMLTALDSETREGVRAVFKLDHCENYHQEIKEGNI